MACLINMPLPVLNVIGITFAVVLAGRKNKMLLSSGVLFSAGVLLAGAFVHMLPHSTEIINNHFEGDTQHSSHDGGDEHYGDESDIHPEDKHTGEDEHQTKITSGGYKKTITKNTPTRTLGLLLSLASHFSSFSLWKRYVDNKFGDADFLHGHDSAHHHGVNTTSPTTYSDSHSHGAGSDCIKCDSEAVKAMVEANEDGDEEAPSDQAASHKVSGS